MRPPRMHGETRRLTTAEREQLQERVLAALDDTPTPKAGIVERTRMNARDVYRALATLVDLGLAERVGWGVTAAYTRTQEHTTP